MKTEHLKRPRLRDLTVIVDELLAKAVDELWEPIIRQWPIEIRRDAQGEARGLWWGAFVLALELGAWRIAERPDAWRWAVWSQWIEEAAISVVVNRAAIEACSAVQSQRGP